ncbi:MAG: patatin-like phospholipase family protein [Bacteroidales bacterium]|nr:patatin-like phospholipase family protein [Bacteroidales bacterium]
MKRIIVILLLTLPLVQSVYAEEEGEQKTRSTRPKVGLVLSGGGAKGMAHIGVLKTLEELEIPVDFVVGTSIGSIMAGIYSLGYKADEIDSLVRSQDWDLLMKDRKERRSLYYEDRKDEDMFLLTFPFMNRQGLTEETSANSSAREKGLLRNMPSALVSGHNLDQLFTKLSVGYQDDIDFNTLPIPFACVAVDMNRREEVVFHSGNIVTAIRASMSIPGYFAPVQLGDKFLIDGGMLNNLPVDVAKEMGADYIITVDLHHFKQTKAEVDQTIPEMVATMLSIMNGEKYQAGRAASDIIIEPNTSAYGVLSFDDESVDALVDSGLVAANRVLPQLKSLAAHLKEFPDPEEKRPPKAINLGRDSVKISQMEIRGTDSEDMTWLISKTDIGPGKYVSGEDMDDAMNFFYSTKCYRKINYSIAGKEGDYRLKINFLPQRLHQAGVGFRFDSEEMASILLGMSLNKYKLFGSKLDTKLKLGSNPYLKVNYSYTFRNLTRVNLTAKLEAVAFNLYDYVMNLEGGFMYGLSSEDRYNVFSATADYQIIGWRDSDFRIGLRYDNYSCLLIDATVDGFNIGERFSNREVHLYTEWNFDNLDDSYFPHKGMRFNLSGAAYYDSGRPLYEARFDFKTAIPLSDRVMLIPQTYNRWAFRYPLRYYTNIIGGYMGERYTPWHFPFVGINNVYRTSPRMDIARVDLRINLFREHYLTLAANYLAEWDFNSDSVFKGHFGAAAIYSLNTIVGPVRFSTHWSNLSKSVGFHFSFGYDF